jgi:hypothetical protein
MSLGVVLQSPMYRVLFVCISFRGLDIAGVLVSCNGTKCFIEVNFAAVLRPLSEAIFDFCWDLLAFGGYGISEFRHSASGLPWFCCRRHLTGIHNVLEPMLSTRLNVAPKACDGFLVELKSLMLAPDLKCTCFFSAFSILMDA